MIIQLGLFCGKSTPQLLAVGAQDVRLTEPP